MKRIYLTLALIGMLAGLVGCTENARSKNFGGNMTIKIPAGNKLVNATWKDSQLWYLYRPHADE